MLVFFFSWLWPVQPTHVSRNQMASWTHTHTICWLAGEPSIRNLMYNMQGC